MTTATPSGADTGIAATDVPAAAGLIEKLLDRQAGGEQAADTGARKQASETDAGAGEQQTDDESVATTATEQSGEGATTEEGGEQQQADSGDTKFETLEELAEATGLPLESLLNIKARTKVDGEEKAIPLSEIVKGYQLESHTTKKSMALAEQQRAFESQRDNAIKEITARVTEAQALTGFLEQNLMQEYNAVNWNQLRTADPAEFAAKKQEYNDKFAFVQGLKARAHQELARINHEQQQETQTKLSEVLKSEHVRLLDAIPEWKDTKKANTEGKEIFDFLTGMGFSGQEIGTIVDHRHVKLVRNAMLFERASKKATIEEKKVKILPKVLKPGTPRGKGNAQSEQQQQSMNQLRKTHNVEDAAAAIFARLK